eukprot:TRINITY_DN8685_c0_g1_i14.p2 TRINITY_DN8685_c0_g1~~TRINITY_DN8685_c0_g1_i14.p2  ORF type:complete len:129 (+),score=33.53 TRINITY_DN8685_c0_g1_i14:102-488(+)
MSAKVVLLYFSGIWCPPCHGFEFVIRNFYKAVNEGCEPGKKNVEIVFVSCDNSVEEFNEHIVPMPFPMLPFDSPKIADLEEDLDVESIPIVPLLRKDGTIARESVRQIIQVQGVHCLPELIKDADAPF